MTRSVEYLGHRLDAAGLQPADKKVKGIRAAPRPTNVTEPKAYLGLLTYYDKFMKGLSTVLGQLHQVVRKDSKWRWTKKGREVVSEVQGTLIIHSGVGAF